MKRFILLAFIIAALVTHAFAQGYKISLEVQGIKDTSVILGYYFNNKMLVHDTTKVDAKGHGLFSGEKPLPQGIYIVYLPDKTYFDFLVTHDQEFSIKTKAPDYLKDLVIVGSDESQKFLANQKFMAHQQALAQNLSARLEKNKGSSDSTAILQKQLSAIGDESKAAMEQNHTGKPKNLFGYVFKGRARYRYP
ncbi:MAG: DUF4369 domain-containing protein [Breznakibacter sp.]